MQNLLNLSEATSLAFHSVAVLAASEDQLIRTHEIAEILLVSEHHLQKVHQRLTKMGILRAVRGPKGGFTLTRPAEEITLLEVYEAMEGKLEPNRCILGRKECMRPECILGSLVDNVNNLVMGFFQQVTLDRLANEGFDQVIPLELENIQ